MLVSALFGGIGKIHKKRVHDGVARLGWSVGGTNVGGALGRALGSGAGSAVGALLGSGVGVALGSSVGVALGSSVGEVLGNMLGIVEVVGTIVGWSVGNETVVWIFAK